VTFRCSAASRTDAEPLAGTAPTEQAFLFVEYAGAWGRDAPALLAEHITIPPGVRTQLIRRHRSTGPGAAGLRVFVAWRHGAGFAVETTTLPSMVELASLDLESLAALRSPGLTPYDEALWLVCTNGRRDVCCAEFGRPVAAALTDRWPDTTWETTHLGGHRFSATLLALPSGITLGRLDPVSSVLACEEIRFGGHVPEHSRGRAGRDGRAQVAELAHPHTWATDVVGDVVTLDDGTRLTVTVELGSPRRQSCADLKEKPAPVFTIQPGKIRPGSDAG